jgi:hydrogenase maturation factor
MMAGTIQRDDVIDKKQMRPGDWVLMTKAVAVEGTAIIAREFEARLISGGIDPGDIASGRDFLERIGIIAEARLAARDHLATAMHDVTEGGLATALEELSVAGEHKIRVDLEHIPVFDQTRKFCEVLGLDPLGLIGSGSLLICCRPQNGPVLIKRLQDAFIAVTPIGRVSGPGAGVEALRGGRPARWPRFEVDEITKLF